MIIDGGSHIALLLLKKVGTYEAANFSEDSVIKMCTLNLIFTKEAHKGRLENVLHFLVQINKQAVWVTKLLDRLFLFTWANHFFGAITAEFAFPLL